MPCDEPKKSALPSTNYAATQHRLPCVPVGSSSHYRSNDYGRLRSFRFLYKGAEHTIASFHLTRTVS